MKLIKKLKSVYTIWLISYLVIILFFSGVLFVVNRIYEDAISDTIAEFNNYVFQKVSDSVNDVYSNINALYTSFVANQNTDDFFKNVSGNYMKHKETYDLIDEFKNYKNFSINIDLFFLYLKESDRVLCNQGVIDGESFYQMYFDTSVMSYDEWKSEYISQRENMYVDMFFKDNNKTYKSNAYIFPIPHYENKGIGVILSKKEYLVSNINEMEWRAFCDIFVFDAYKEIIVSVVPSDNIAKVSYDELLSEEKGNIVHNSEIVVNNDKWYVVTRIQHGVLEKRINVVKNLILFTVTLGGIILVFLVKYLLKRNYQPMNRIFGLLGTSTQQESYSEIYTKVDKFVEQNRNLIKDNEKKKEKLKKVAVSKFIRGDISQSELLRENITVNEKYFTVVLFDISDIDELFGEDKELQSYERYYYLSFILQNIFKEMFEDRNMEFYLTDVENYIVGLIGMDTPQEEATVKVVIQEGISFINEQFEISLSYVMSSVAEGIDTIPKAYDETLQLQFYRQFAKINDSLSQGDVSYAKAGKYLFGFYREQNLIRYIKTADYNAAATMTAEIFEELRYSGAKSLRYMQCLVADILNTVIKIKDELSDEEFGNENEIELYDELVQSKDIDFVKEKLLLHVKNVCESIKISLSEKPDKNRVQINIERIMKYVQENFTDVNMNVNQISNHFDLTPQYIAKIFREYAQTSLLDYINRLRIEYAQELSRSGEYTAKEISKMAGFSNERTYYRILKKYTT